MIDRYDSPRMSALWTRENKLKTFLKVEIALIKSQNFEQLKEYNLDQEFKNVSINLERVDEIEKEVQHDVIAFCSSIAEQLSPEVARFFHFGVTSSDIIDTALSIMLKESIELCLEEISILKKVLLKKIDLSKNILTLGRSHGIEAEPMIFAQKFLLFYAELSRSVVKLNELKNNLSGQFSGAVGNYTVLDHETEEIALKSLGLNVEALSTQVIPRDHIARIVSEVAIVASSFDRMAIELRHLQHSDIGECFEGFSKNQKGSSTMPHKKNPISSENISGLTRLLKSYVSPVLDNISLWHERDISHSSVERILLPDCFGLFSYIIKRMASTIDSLHIDTEKIESKVRSNKSILSSFYLHEILKQTNLSREEAYRVVQEACFNNRSSIKEDIEDKVSNLVLPDWSFEDMKNFYMKKFNKTFIRVVKS